MKIHGLEANVLLDLGCMVDSVSPEFTISANLKVHELEEPVPLQLGMVGSQSKINFGLFAEFKLGTVRANHYFNVINLNRYDAIMGTVFMRKYGLILDFKIDLGHPTVQEVVSEQQLSDLNEVLFAICKELAKSAKAQGPLGKKDILQLREEWLEVCKDILQGVPERPPPMREINHQIPLVDEKKRYNYHLPKCPNSMQQPLADKIERYCRVGWWRPVPMEQATPMLVVPKKNGDIHTMVNMKKRNDNTVKNVMPFPDQDLIRLDVARAKY
ncbi:hypothetical protein L208DRAFT_1145161, partial [Tricholoma matsutake]